MNGLPRRYANLSKTANTAAYYASTIADSLTKGPTKESRMSDPKKCAHSACTCMTTETYCSTYCEENKDTVEIACKCGHAGCDGEIA